MEEKDYDKNVLDVDDADVVIVFTILTCK